MLLCCCQQIDADAAAALLLPLPAAAAITLIDCGNNKLALVLVFLLQCTHTH